MSVEVKKIVPKKFLLVEMRVGGDGVSFSTRLQDKLISILERNYNAGTKFKGIGINGMGGLSFDSFRPAVTQVIAESAQGLEPKSGEAIRVSEMAPDLLEALISSPTIVGITPEYYANVVRFSIEAARNPKLISETVIRVGFGGSDDSEVSMRWPAYLIPALNLLEKFDVVRNKRRDAATRALINSRYKTMVSGQNFAGMEKSEIAAKKTQIGEQAREDVLNDVYQFAEDEINRSSEEAGVFELPSVELFFVPHTGITINHKDKDRTLGHTKKSIKLASAFLDRFYPQYKKYFHVEIDKPWKHDFMYTDLLFGYFEEVIQDHANTEVLQALKGRSANHINGAAHHTHSTPEALYAALHPIIFGDQLGVPVLPAVMRRNLGLVTITIGGRPERLFNHVRDVISEHATIEGLTTYIQKKVQGETDQKRINTLMHIQKRLQNWHETTENRRVRYSVDDSFRYASADLPLLMLPLITTIGQHPVYYQRAYDLPLTQSTIAEISDKLMDGLMEQKFFEFGDTGHEARALLKSLQTDMRVLTERVGEEALWKFYSDFLATNK